MAHADLIDGLIATYRELNLKIRPMSEEQLNTAGPNGESVRQVVQAMRRREIITSQQLKAMMLADAAGVSVETVDPTLVDAGENLQTRVLLSEFGTARESILAQVREMPAEALDRELAGADGPMSVSKLLSRLVEQDASDRAKIDRLIPGSAS